MSQFKIVKHLRTLLAIGAIAIAPCTAFAQLYDSGWRIVEADALSDLELTGAGVKINNLIITESGTRKPDQPLGTYEFAASALKRAAGRRDVRVELVGFKADKTPTIVSVVVINIYDEQTNKSATSQHRFVANPTEVAETKTYFIRALIP